MKKPHLLPPEPTEAEIQHAAYFLWEQEGRPAGRDFEIWLSARERLKHTVHEPGHERMRPAAPPGRKKRA